MPLPSDLNGGGSWCPVSPSDMAGQIDNLLSRIEQLEQDLAEIKAQNTLAIQLSDFANAAGWIEDVTYMGMPGWTQTPAGTLIPPADGSFTVSQILADAQANQLHSSGTGVGITTLARFSGGQPTLGVPKFTLIDRTDEVIDVVSPQQTFTFSSAGWYMFLWNVRGVINNPDTIAARASLSHFNQLSVLVKEAKWQLDFRTSGMTGTSDAIVTMSPVFKIANSNHTVAYSSSGFANGTQDPNSISTIIKIRDL